MRQISTIVVAAVTVLLLCNVSRGDCPAKSSVKTTPASSNLNNVNAPTDAIARFPSTQVATEIKIDPAIFFEKLVDRYRKVNFYRDVVSVVQVTWRDGKESSRVESRMACEVTDGQLKVQTSSAQMRENLGVDLPIKKTQAMNDVQKKYDLWLAPHMTLKFTDQPLKQMRAGVDEGFTATEAESITIANKKMIHVELRSGDGLSENAAAKVDLYVNSDSMLIERVESQQILPDGANYSTTLEITPEPLETEAPVAARAVSENSPAR